MSRETPSQFAPSWFSAQDHSSAVGKQQALGFVRLWRTFMRARLFIASVLLALQLFVLATHTAGPSWLLLISVLHLGAALAVLLWLHPIPNSPPLHPQWLLTIGIDVLVFACLQHLQYGGISYTPLFALPVLLAALLGSLTLALTTAACLTLLLLAEAALGAFFFNEVSSARFLQAALTGTGFFLIALLAQQLAVRLARQEALTQSSQSSARAQAQVNALVIENLSEGVLVVDSHAVVRNSNPAAQAMLMHLPHPQQARARLSARAEWADLAMLVNKTFVLGQPQTSELNLAMDENHTHRLRVRSRLTSVPDESEAGLCVLFLEDLREVEARLRTEKLAAMGRLSAAVAHEIRNPLSAIAQANALLEEDASQATQKRLTHMIDQNVQRLARIVDDILNVVRVQSGAADPAALVLPLDAALHQISREWSQQHQVGAILSLHTRAPRLRIGFDHEHLRRLLVNLLDNARRHCSGAPASIRLSSQPSGSAQVRLSVWSDGAPLEAGVLRHLFEPFFSTDSRASGMGLYICRELCQRYGAQIAYQRLRLEQGPGNEFYLLMPAAAPPHPPGPVTS